LKKHHFHGIGTYKSNYIDKFECGAIHNLRQAQHVSDKRLIKGSWMIVYKFDYIEAVGKLRNNHQMNSICNDILQNVNSENRHDYFEVQRALKDNILQHKVHKQSLQCQNSQRLKHNLCLFFFRNEEPLSVMS
jgi:hypothetical protein